MNFTLDEKMIIWLDMFDFLTIEKRHQILSCYETPQEVFSCFKQDYHLFEKFINQQQFATMCNALNMEVIDNYICCLENKNIKILTYLTVGYPKEFVNYYHYPLVLYCKGDISLIGSMSVAVVGTRKASKYGVYVTEKLTKDLVENDVTIVSGMASGIDTVAHYTALKNGGKTIAVLGSGFDEIYPKSNYQLYEQIAAKGLVVTEYVPSMPALAHNFPVRNRIIAMLSNGIVMTEAGIKSGAHYTIDYGVEYGKEIFAVPGNIDSYASQGCNLLLKRYNTSLVTCADDILQGLHIDNKSQKNVKKLQISLEEQTILNVLGNDELFFDEIVSQTKFDTKTCVRLLTTLELTGIIKKSAGNYYSRIIQD